MSGFLLDTNCISEVVRVSPNQGVLSWLGAAEESLLYLSVLTLGEIRKGVASLTQSKRRTLLESWLEAELRVRFAGRILSIDAGVTDRWGVLAAEVKAKGAVLSTIDGLLAATALHHNLTIVSRNIGDFAHTHVPVLNPWKA
jgi:predicted nucleic acid-binding protein